MLSRIISTARGIIPFQKPTAEASPEAHSPIGITPPKMVTTRRQSGNKAALGQEREGSPLESEIPKELLSPESRKRRRDLAKEEGSENVSTPRSAAKRQKKLVGTSLGGDSAAKESHSHFEAEIPVAELDGDADEDATNVVSSTAEAVKEGNKIVATPRKKAVAESANNKSNKAASAQQLDTTPKPVAKSKHKRFGSEEVAEEIPEPSKPQTIEDSEEEESDDDEAPEVVATNVAEEQVKKAAKIASKAAETQEATLRAKRKERDAKLKKAKQVSNKRKEAETSIVDEEAESEDDDDEASGSDDEADAATRITKKLKLDRSNLPAFLPAEFLSDTEELQDADTEDAGATYRKPTKIRFLDEDLPKDVRVGSTVVKVAQRDLAGASLPPKANKNVKNLKQGWLEGRAGKSAGGGVRKKASSGGFFVSKDQKRKR